MWSSCKALKMSILTGFGFLAAVVVCCRGIFIVKLSEDATAKRKYISCLFVCVCVCVCVFARMCCVCDKERKKKV